MIFLSFSGNTVFAATEHTRPMSSASQTDQASNVTKLHRDALLAQENQWIANFVATHPFTTKSLSQQVIRGEDLAQKNRLQIEQALQSRVFQEQLTAQWMVSHPSNKLSTVLPNTSPVIPYGAVTTSVSYQAGTNFYVDDPNQSAPNLTVAEDVVQAIAGHWSSTLAKIIEVAAAAFGYVQNNSMPMSSLTYHTYRYGFKDVYVYNGSSWVLTLTIEDRQWWRHNVVNFVTESNKTIGETYNAPSPIYTNWDSEGLWNNETLMDQVAESNFTKGISSVDAWY